ncbi:MAG: hypothetical protein KAQ92_06485 [Candidatus Aenigmarchaeota archaeon]|nr:hypothetical protein [Candidatus Aenigmarchaeota archaeon]
MEQIYEIKYTHISNIPIETQQDVRNEVSKKPASFKDNWKSICKIVYVTASPIRIKSIEPVEGTASECFQREVGANSSVL